MSAFRLLPIVFVLAACESTSNPSRSSPDGSTQVQIADGRNCWNNQCLRFSKRNRSIAVTGRHPVRVPRNIDVRDGYVTEAEFAAMFQAANMAYSTGAGRR